MIGGFPASISAKASNDFCALCHRSFNVDGTLHFTDKAGKNPGRWAAIDANTIVTQIDDGKHIDRFEFTPDRVGYRVKYIGAADKTRRQLTGQLIRKN